MSAPLLDQELTLSGDKVTAGQYASVPSVMRGQIVEYTFYFYFGASVSAGKFQIRSAFAEDSPGTWAAEGNTIDWAAATAWKVVHLTAVEACLRVYIDTTIANGPVQVFVVAAAPGW